MDSRHFVGAAHKACGGSIRYVSSGKCVQCTRARVLACRAKNPDINRLYYAANAEAERARSREKGRLRLAKILARRRALRATDSGRASSSAANAMRRATVLRAAPAWLSREQRAAIRGVYLQSALASKDTGVRHHVDHIVPLRGKTASGLHVPWNLQVLTASENCRKSNHIED